MGMGLTNQGGTKARHGAWDVALLLKRRRQGPQDPGGEGGQSQRMYSGHTRALRGTEGTEDTEQRPWVGQLSAGALGAGGGWRCQEES